MINMKNENDMETANKKREGTRHEKRERLKKKKRETGIIN